VTGTSGQKGQTRGYVLACATDVRDENSESRKRELKTRLIYKDRCDERLEVRVKLRNLHVSHTLGSVIPAVIHT
jgi:hypothetical protein